MRIFANGFTDMTVLHLIFEFVFYGVCGWVGYITVRAVTFGKVELDWGGSSESVVAEAIGAGVLIALAMLVALILESAIGSRFF